MVLSDIATILNNIQGFRGKVAYRFFPENEAPSLPFICYYSSGAESFGADDITYSSMDSVTIELYSARKDRASEALVETALTDNGLYYDKEETYIDNEHCYLIIYNIEV